VIDPSITDAMFGELFLGGKSQRTARRVIQEHRIPHQIERGHWLIRQSDAEAWRESRTVTPEAPTLKSMVADIAARVRTQGNRRLAIQNARDNEE